MKISFKIIVLGTILGLIVAGCGSNASNGEGEGSDKITYATPNQITGLSPVEDGGLTSIQVQQQIYEPLFVRESEELEVEPVLAESYDNPDDTTWLIELKEDIEFHDGTPMNAEAVKYSLEEEKDGDEAAKSSIFEDIENISVEDEYTVKIETEEPNGALIDDVLSRPNAAIFSPEAYEEGDLNQEPVGTGPYEFEEWEEGKHVTLSKNDDYWGDEPKNSELEIKEVPDEGTLISMLQNEEVDFVDEISQEQVSRVEDMDDVEMETKEGTGVFYLGFNMDEEPMSDMEFRKAIGHAIDRDEWVDKLDEKGAKSDSIAGSYTFGYTESADDVGYDYDTEKAEEIVQENGWENKEISLIADTNPPFEDMTVFLQDQLSKVGLDVEVDTYDPATFPDVLEEGEFDIFVGSFTTGGNNALYDVLYSGSAPSPNRTRYDNAEFDELVKGSRETMDQDEREEMLVEANELAIEEAPWIVMNHDVVVGAHNKSIDGYTLSPAATWFADKIERK